MRHALGARSSRWLSLTGSANMALTVIAYLDDQPMTVLMFNDLSHLTGELHWTGFTAECGRDQFWHASCRLAIGIECRVTQQLETHESVIQ